METFWLSNVLFAIFVCSCFSSAVTIPSIDMTVELRPTTQANEIINQNDEIFVGPVSNNLMNTPISDANTKPVRKHFEFLLSKMGLLGDLFLSVNKWSSRQRPIPTFQPPPSGVSIQNYGQHQEESIAGAAISQQQSQQPHYQIMQPSLELFIKGPPIPNIQPLINAVPVALITGYKSLVDKISATSLVWDKSINLPFLSVKKSGRLGTSPPTLGTLVSGTGLHHNDGDSQINTFLDIRDPVSP